MQSSQLAFQQDSLQTAERICCPDGDKMSTPTRRPESISTEDGNERHNAGVVPKARKSMSDHLKRAMLVNAAAPSSVSRTAMQKEAVVTEEISVAMQAMESVSMEKMDLRPFFGLPTKVKALICNLKGIKDLYGEWISIPFPCLIACPH